MIGILLVPIGPVDKIEDLFVEEVRVVVRLEEGLPKPSITETGQAKFEREFERKVCLEPQQIHEVKFGGLLGRVDSDDEGWIAFDEEQDLEFSITVMGNYW